MGITAKKGTKKEGRVGGGGKKKEGNKAGEGRNGNTDWRSSFLGIMRARNCKEAKKNLQRFGKKRK